MSSLIQVPDTPLLRVALLLILAGAIAGGWLLLQLWQRRHLKTLQGESLPLPQNIAAQLADVPAAVLAFSTRTCAECRTRQAPALKRLLAALGPQVRVISIDPLEHPSLAAHLGILTVPATVVLDSSQCVRHLNLGYASDQKLQEQVLGIDA